MDAKEDLEAPSGSRMLPSEREHDTEHEPGVARAVLDAVGLWAMLLVKLVTAVVGVVVLAAAVALFPVWACIRHTALPNLAFKLAFKLGYTLHVFTPLGRMLHLRMVKSRRDNQLAPHTVKITPSLLATCDVLPVPILNDNYGYIIIDRATRQAAVVDAADPELIIEMLQRRRVKLAMVLTTHRHADHAGGNLALRKHYPECVFVAGAKDNCAGTTKPVVDGDSLSLGETHLSVIETPCHTDGHVVYLIHSKQVREGERHGNEVEAALTGDCLFIGGVGAFFHGGEAEMHQCMKNLAWIGDSCLILCGHEYTVENTRFAAWLEPNNASVVSRNLWAVKRRAHREPTVGRVTLGEERQLNPFLRVRDPEFALMTLRRSAKLNLEKGKWYLKWRSLLARRSKADLYLHDDDEPSSHGANHVELGDLGSTASLPLLPDQEAIVVMKRLHRLMRVWSAEQSHQLPPCCVHGTCVRRLTCSGHTSKGHALRNQMVQTDASAPHVQRPQRLVDA